MLHDEVICKAFTKQKWQKPLKKLQFSKLARRKQSTRRLDSQSSRSSSRSVPLSHVPRLFPFLASTGRGRSFDGSFPSRPWVGGILGQH